MDNPDTMQPVADGQPSRRRLLKAVGIGGAVTALVASTRPAGAQEATTTTPEATTTTAPPRKPGAADLPLIAAAKIVELTAAAAYAAATARIDQLGLDDPTKELLIGAGAHHQAYAEALSAMYGPGSPSSPSESLATKLGADQFANGDGPAVLAAALALEEAAVDTHLGLLGQLQSTDAAALVASIQIVEARHAAVLAVLTGTAYGAGAPATEDGAQALTPADITGEQ